MKRIKQTKLIFFMLITDILIILIQCSIIIIIFLLYGGKDLTRIQDRWGMGSFFCIILNELLLLMKLHNNCKDHYRAKLKRGLTLRAFAIFFSFIGITVQLEIGHSRRESSSIELFNKYQKSLIGLGITLFLLLNASIIGEMVLKGKSRKGKELLSKKTIENVQGALLDLSSI